jgi:hypothetical protein
MGDQAGKALWDEVGDVLTSFFILVGAFVAMGSLLWVRARDA